VGDAVDEDLGLGSGVLLVADPVCVGELVGERADLLVGGAGGDDELAAVGVAPAARPVLGEVADLDAVSELGGVADQRGDQVVVAVAGDGLGRRG
jgi:hypothetical protein